MRILVTGSWGNIGSHTVRELVRQGHTVRAFDLETPRNVETARPYREKVEIWWGDIRDPGAVAQAVDGQDLIVHLACIIPPGTDENPTLAYQVNVEGTKYIVEAAQKQANPPRLLYASSLDVFGHTQHLPPPRRVTDPIQATDQYTAHKIECEQYVRASSLDWAIFRFADVPPMKMRSAHPIMYRIPLDTRFEVIHPDDVALAIANAVNCPEVWGTISLIGGGNGCQITYREYLNGMLALMGIGALPESAFSTEPYCTDWLDTEASQRLLQYQRHSYQAILGDLKATMGLQPYLGRLIGPVARLYLLRLSPHYKK